MKVGVAESVDKMELFQIHIVCHHTPTTMLAQDYIEKFHLGIYTNIKHTVECLKDAQCHDMHDVCAFVLDLCDCCRVECKFLSFPFIHLFSVV